MAEVAPIVTALEGKPVSGPDFQLRRELTSGSPRREVKFFLREADPEKVRTILKTNGSAAGPGPSGSVVTSIYFDDAGHRSYHENVEGTGERIKLRIRWYDDGDRRFFFERKRRLFERSVKDRVELSSSAPLRDLDYRTILARLRDRLPEPYREQLAVRANPVLITRYRRSYYLANDRRLRMTLDSDLEWFDQSGRVRPHFRFGASLPRLVILELKAEGPDDVRLDEYIHPLRLRRTRSSKYVVGCHLLGLVPDTRGGF